jgi:hypothetical protein
MKNLILLLLVILSTSFVLHSEEEETFFWPKEIDQGGYNVTLYQPQYDGFEQNILKGRMALSVQKDTLAPVFGALFFKARLETDTEERTAVLEKLDIERILFPGYEDTVKIERFSKLLVEEIESWDVVMSLDRIIASLTEVEDLKELSVQLNNDPPDIYFRTAPSVLVTIDGDPILTDVEGADFQYVVNTPFFIVKDKSKYYIKGGKYWYVSKDIDSGYEETTKVPNDIEKFATDNLPDDDLDSISESITETPELVVVTKPSELVITDGKPEYASIEGTTLLFVSNTDSDIVMEIETQNHYILLAGRWYYSNTLEDGDWTFAEPDELPVEFEKIPEESDMGNVRASIPGTEEAEYALLEQTIPQTATVDRTTTVEVEWDGDPKFKDVKGTEVKVAKNSDKTVLKIEDKYYCVDDAIWFVADDPKGSWKVSDIRPDEVDELPPESEAYNVKYVYVYESTPEVVYVGYLPGYTCSYVYGGTVVYGTGFWYRPWWGAVYYPRPVTWGFGVHWNPWTGWGFSFGMSFGWVGWRFHPHRAWWGPRGFHRGYRHGYRRGFHHGYRRGAAAGYRAGYRAGSRNSNVYRNRASGVRTTTRNQVATGNRNLNNKARPSTRPNNVYADRNGNVYQRNQNGNWENRNNSGRTRDQAANRDLSNQGNRQTQDRSNQNYNQGNRQTQDRSNQNYNQNRSNQNYNQSNRQSQNRQGSGSSGMSSQQRQQMNQSYNNRSTGTQNYNRSQSYNRGASRSSYGSSRSGASRSGGSRGGGGGRRR